MRIMDSRDQVLRRKVVRLVKVLWQHRGAEEATWESKDTMRATCPSYLRMKVRYLKFGTRINISYACVCVLISWTKFC